MTNKQSVQQQPKAVEGGGHSIADEEPFANDYLILHSWLLVKEQVQRVIEFNKQQGIPNPGAYIGYNYADGTPEPMSVKQKLGWLKIVKHKRTGEFLTLDQLKSSGVISQMELEQVFKDQIYPSISLSGMTRVKTQEGSEYLLRNMRAIGLSDIGAVVSLPLPDCDFTRKVTVTPTTAKLPDGNDVKILQVGTGEFYYESSPKIYTTPWSKENVLAAIQKYPPSEDNGGKISYTFQKDGVTNGVSVSSLEDFLSEDFDSVWETKRQPTPQININSRDLATFVKLDRESKTEHKQYS